MSDPHAFCKEALDKMEQKARQLVRETAKETKETVVKAVLDMLDVLGNPGDTADPLFRLGFTRVKAEIRSLMDE